MSVSVSLGQTMVEWVVANNQTQMLEGGMYAGGRSDAVSLT